LSIVLTHLDSVRRGTNPTFARARDQSGKTKLARAKTRAKRPTKQPVDLIDDDHIDLARLDIGDQPFQGWPLRRAAGKPAIIIERRQHLQPSCFCDRMKAAQASRWASSELKACSSPSSDDFRV
jgi:hypothetical protein